MIASVTWIIYDHPNDHPTLFVMRKFVGGEPTHELYGHKDLDRLRELMVGSGRDCHKRNEGDDATVVETWK